MICKLCRNTFETDEKSIYCKSCVDEVKKKVHQLLEQKRYDEADKLLREIQ